MIVHYDESILSSVAAVRDYFQLSSSYPAEKRLRDLLEKKKPKQIFLILIDAMGAHLIQRKLASDAFVNRHLLYKTMTVFPPTTVAATTSIRSGKAPNENAWLGWIEYMEDFDDEIIPFLGVGVDSKINYGTELIEKSFPVISTTQELQERGISAIDVMPSFVAGGCCRFPEMVDRLIDYSQKKEHSYIYAYWDQYDTTMHRLGVDCEESDRVLVDINSELERLSQNLSEDTMMIVLADHGQVDVKEEINLAHTKYAEYFYRRPCIEPRAQAFYVKPEYHILFEKEFKKDFSDYYVLLTKQQVLDSCLFGTKQSHPSFESMIGDFVAIAKSDHYFSYNSSKIKENIFKGHHAGMHMDELMVPVIVYMK